MDELLTLDDFQNEAGEKVAKPYLPFLKDLSANDEYWSYNPAMRFLKTKYGTIHVDWWETLKKENEDTTTNVRVCVKGNENQCVHPAESLAERRTLWLSLLMEKEPDYGEIDKTLSLLWRVCRVDGLIELLDYGQLKHLTNAEYWELVQDYWIDSESPFQQWDDWLRLFEEREADSSSISHLPDEVIIYRGGNPNGVSWTTSLETASWFARRSSLCGGDEIQVWETTISKHKIIFYTNKGQENEVLLGGTPPTNTIKSAKPKFAEVA